MASKTVLPKDPLNPSLEEAAAAVAILVHDFSASAKYYLSSSYQEAEVRKDFIDKFPEKSRLLNLSQKSVIFMNATYYELARDANSDSENILIMFTIIVPITPIAKYINLRFRSIFILSRNAIITSV